MRLNRVTGLILLMCLIIIGVASWAISQPSPTVRPTADPAINQVFPVRFADVVRWRVQADGGAVDGWFVRAGDGSWGLAGVILPAQARLAQGAVDTALGNLISLRTTARFSAEDLALYGLDQPAFSLEVETASARYSLRLGGLNPAGDRYYALVPGGAPDEVYLVSGVGLISAIVQLAQDPPLLYPPTPTALPSLSVPGPIFPGYVVERIVQLDLAGPEGLVSLRRTQTGWLAGDQPADNLVVAVLLQAISGLRAVDGIAGVDLARLGLTTPPLTLTAVNDAGRVYRLRLGGLDVTETRYYALVDDFDTVVIVAREPVDIVFATLADPPILPAALTP